MGRPLSNHFHLASATRAWAGGLAGSRAQQLADLKEVQFHRVHQPGRLAVLGRCADRDRVILDDVSDAEPISGCRSEAKVSQTWVAAVRGRQDCVVDLVPAGVAEDGRRGRHRTHAAEAEAVGRRHAILRHHFGKLGRVEARGSVLHGAGVAVGAGVHTDVGRRRSELVKGALPQAVQRIQMSVLTLSLGTLLGDGCVFLGRLPESVHLLLRWVVTPEGSDEFRALVGHRANRFGPSVEEELGHGRFVGALQTAVETIVGSLEGHLQKCIGREAHGSDKVLTEPFKVQHLKVVLVDQIGQVGFGESQGDAQLRGHVPLELPRCSAHIAKAARVSLRWVGAACRPESWGLSVDCLGETEDGIGVDIAGEPQHRVAIHTGVFEVDTCAAVLANNDLELVIPPVGASTHLHAPDHLAGSADHVCTELRCALGFDIVQTEDEQRRVDNVQALRVVRALVPGQDISHSRPHLTVLCAENTQRALRSILDGRLFSILDDDLEVEGNVLLAHDQITVLVENIKPIDLSAAQNRKVLRTRILADNTAILGWNTRSTEQS